MDYKRGPLVFESDDTALPLIQSRANNWIDDAGLDRHAVTEYPMAAFHKEILHRSKIACTYGSSGTLLTAVTCEKIEPSATMEACEHIRKR